MKNARLDTFWLAPGETIEGGPRSARYPGPRPFFERVRSDFAGWTVHRVRIASVLFVLRYRRGV